jgi:glucosamine--fructose-6-phosphate aminotransferase (isomerizing)
MCGIIGYTGREDAVSRIMAGLTALEYRGYDSSGIAAFENGELRIVKAKGRLKNIQAMLDEKPVASHCGIGHTRWATHGEPSDVNAHPHGTGQLYLVHNGIVENYLEWKRFLESHGYQFQTETDTEVAAKLIDYHYAKTCDPFKALVETANELTGAYAFGVVFRDAPGTIYAARKDSPLIVAPGEDGSYMASDIPALLRYTRSYYQLEPGEIAILKPEGIRIVDFTGAPVEKKLETAQWDVEAAEKGGFAHFMLKEIHEEPEAILRTLRPRVQDGLPALGLDALTPERLKGLNRLIIVGCGTAMHAGLVGKGAIEKLARLPVEVSISSEFRYQDPILTEKDLVVLISQSGETADSLAALRLSKSRGALTLGVVNAVGSSIAREADAVLYTWAGPEIAVASTKAFTVQLIAMYLVALTVALARGTVGAEEAKAIVSDMLNRIPPAVQRVIDQKEKIQALADDYRHAENLFFIGRGLDWALSQEGSLKLKEISYIHSEAYAAGELKHGAISLITKGMPVIALATDEALYPKLLSGVKEVKARGARVILIELEGAPDDGAADDVFRLPRVRPLLTPLVSATMLQLFAYYVAVLRGCDVDKPRNLAKSVTVE